MKRDMVKLQEILSGEIFSRRFAELGETQQAFVNYHGHGYHGYVKKVAPVIRQALRKKLHREYDTILDLYCLRLPPEYFQNAVDKGVKEARKKRKATYSIGWFDRHFSEYVERYKQDVASQLEGRIDVEIDYPWLYNIFRHIRESDNDFFIFDPFWGFRERKVRIASILEMLQEARREVERVERDIVSLQETLDKTNLDKKTKKRFRNRLKWYKKKSLRKKEKLQELEAKWEEINGE